MAVHGTQQGFIGLLIQLRSFHLASVVSCPDRVGRTYCCYCVVKGWCDWCNSLGGGGGEGGVRLVAAYVVTIASHALISYCAPT